MNGNGVGWKLVKLDPNDSTPFVLTYIKRNQKINITITKHASCYQYNLTYVKAGVVVPIEDKGCVEYNLWRRTIVNVWQLLISKFRTKSEQVEITTSTGWRCHC